MPARTLSATLPLSVLVVGVLACSSAAPGATGAPDSQTAGRASESASAGATSAGARATASGGSSDGSAGAVGTAACAGPDPGEPFDGDVTIVTSGDVDAARSYSEISGTLTVFGVEGLAVELPNLVRVGGDVHVDSTDIASLVLPNLTAIGGELWLYLNLSMLDLDLRSLETTGGQVYVHRNIAVTSAQLFSLKEINGNAATGFEFTAQLSLPSCFEDRLIELYPKVNITAGNGPVCDDCAFACNALVASCAP